MGVKGPESRPDSDWDRRGNPCGCPNPTVRASLVGTKTGDNRANANDGQPQGLPLQWEGVAWDHPGSIYDDEKVKMTVPKACSCCGSRLNLAVDHLIRPAILLSCSGWRASLQIVRRINCSTANIRPLNPSSLLQNSAKGSSIGRGSGKAVRLETSLLIRFGVCLREGSCPPGARASRPHRSGRSPAGPLCLRFTQRAPILRIRLGEEHPATASPAHSRRQWRWLASCLQKKGAGGTPALPGGLPPHDRVTPRGQNCRSVPEPLVVEGSPSVFVSIRVHSWFVFFDGHLSRSHLPAVAA